MNINGFDGELLRVIQLGLADCRIETDDYFLYQVGKTIIGIEDEYSDAPKVHFLREFADEYDALEFIEYLQEAAAEKETNALKLDELYSDLEQYLLIH
jgi:hypothetical protein